jgi:hypothetical protein
MASLVLNGNTSGSVTISSPAVSGTTTLTLPTTSGTVITTGSTFAGTGPAFSAYASANQTPASNTYTKVQFNTETFDTNSNYDPTTNYRFTPTVAGYYQVNAMVTWAGAASATYLLCAIYKNGANILEGGVSNNAIVSPSISISDLVSLNGSTDYLEVFILSGNGTNATLHNGIKQSLFSAAMVRSA